MSHQSMATLLSSDAGDCVIICEVVNYSYRSGIFADGMILALNNPGSRMVIH